MLEKVKRILQTENIFNIKYTIFFYIVLENFTSLAKYTLYQFFKNFTKYVYLFITTTTNYNMIKFQLQVVMKTTSYHHFLKLKTETNADWAENNIFNNNIKCFRAQ